MVSGAKTVAVPPQHMRMACTLPGWASSQPTRIKPFGPAAIASSMAIRTVVCKQSSVSRPRYGWRASNRASVSRSTAPMLTWDG